MRLRVSGGLLLVVSVCVAAEPAPKPIPKDEQDLIFFQSSRPLHLRLHLQVAGRSFQAHWDEIMAQLFRFLDQDGNGRLSAKEAEHAPSVAQLRGMIQSKPDVEADEAPKYSDLTDDAAAGVSIEQLKGYYHRVGVAPWHIVWVDRNGVADHLDDALFQGLSPKKPEQVNAAAFNNGPSLMRKFDSNNDELIAAIELHQNSYAGGFMGEKPPTPDGPFFVLDPSDKGRSLLADALLKRYDASKDGKLVPAEIALDPVVFAKLDRNGDRALDAREIGEWANGPADLALVVRLDGPAQESIHVVPGAPLNAATKLQRVGAAQLQLPDAAVEILRVEALERRQERLQQKAVADFATLDSNKDNVLESKEVFQPPFEMVAFLRLADRDGNSSLSLEEFQQFLELQKKVITRCVIITLVSRGRCFFDFLDSDHDHRLSRRELASGAERLSPWMDATTKSIERGKVPQQFQIIVSQGQLPRVDSDPGTISYGKPEARLRGPLWFRKMDRNADGDVSLVEFLGTPEQFRQLDLDRDGLIGLPEAEAAGSAYEKRAGPKK